MKLTPHFTLQELTHSDTALQLGIDNTPDSTATENLQNLCRQVLEPLRQHLGTPVTISSGYRSPRLNQAVGGAPGSQHLTGEAADIRLPLTPYLCSDGLPHTDTARGREWMLWLMDNTDFDQLIWETANRKDYWIHVSCRRDRSQNRHQVIRFLLKS